MNMSHKTKTTLEKYTKKFAPAQYLLTAEADRTYWDVVGETQFLWSY